MDWVIYITIFLGGLLAGLCLTSTLSGAFVLETLREIPRLFRRRDSVFDLEHLLLNRPVRPTTGWGNFGYWTGGNTIDFVRANRELARALGDLAGLSRRDQLLDFGSGCGDQLVFWREEYGVKKIRAVNPVEAQNQLARERVSQLEGHPVEIVTGGNDLAGQMTGGEYQVILALDCAYHFKERREFFEHGRRIVGRNGRLVFSDIVRRRTPGKLAAPVLNLFFSLARIPAGNRRTARELRGDLETAGFGPVEVRPVTNRVLGGYARFIREYYRHRRSEVPARLWLRFLLVGRFVEWACKRRYIDYVLVRAG